MVISSHKFIVLSVVFFFVISSFAETPKIIKLPEPQTDIGKPLMQAMKERATSRSFSAEPLPEQTLSNLLWAAFGINRPETGGRTAPSAMNMQEIDVYIALPNGLFLYDAKQHALIEISKDDIREQTGMQPFVKDAPINLLFVADFTKMTGRRGALSDEDKVFYSATDVGYISQNVYLFCASVGLATVVRGAINRDEIAKAIGLRPDQKVILAQTVGFPKK
jgi:SagB-type dehydrogenase family enzyme